MGSWFAATTIGVCGAGLLAFHLASTAKMQDRIDNPAPFIAAKIKQYGPLCNPDTDPKVLEQNPQRDMTCENKWVDFQMNQTKLTLKHSKAMTFAITGLFSLGLAGCAAMIVTDMRRLRANRLKPE